MLCNSKINNRPDRFLQNRLILLSFSLVLLTIAVILFFIYPQYNLYLILLTVALTSSCIILTIKTLSAGEEAISYGGFVNEVIKNDFKAKRIENSLGEAIIENEPAKELLKKNMILSFLEEHLGEGTANKIAFYRLQSAMSELTSEKVTLSLELHSEQGKIFNDLEWFDITLRPIYLKKTNIFEGAFSIKKIKKETYFYWSIDNITADKNMMEVFQLEKKSLVNFLDYMPVGLYVADKDYNIEYANNLFLDFLGENSEIIQNKNLSEFLATNSPLPAKSDGWNGEMHFTNKKQDVNSAYVFQSCFQEEGKNKVRGVVVNKMPTPKDLKSDLENAYDTISWLFNFAPVGIMFVNPDGSIKDGNEKAFEFLNLPKENVATHSFLDFVREDEATQIKNEFEAISQNNELSKSLDVHLNNQQKDNVTLMYVSSMQKLHNNKEQKADGLVLYLIDATKQKNLEMQFAQAQKMQAVGQLAGGVAHDFNNLLTAMIGFCDLLLQRHGVGDPSFADLIQIKQNANRAAGLVRQLLAFSRKQPLKPKLIDVTENFVELSHMLKRILGEQVSLQFNHGSELGYIRVDPVQFSQVIINLCVNAKDAMENNGVLNISTHTTVLSDSYQFGDDIIKPGEFVVIDVKDTGCGIPTENLIRIFDPFFSTKQNIVGSGTGLGLAMVYGIVRQTEGFIKVDSEIDKGTTFSIYLPRFETPEEEEVVENSKEIVTSENGKAILRVQEKNKAPTSINQKLIFGLNLTNSIDRSHTCSAKKAELTRVLFVEDEDSVRAFAVRALKKKGYNVIGCNSAENALDYFEKDNKFDLLITDMVMPGLSGAQLTKIIKEKSPSIKVILASGYSEEIVRQELDNSEDFEFMTKPYSLGDLTAKVFDVLNDE